MSKERRVWVVEREVLVENDNLERTLCIKKYAGYLRMLPEFTTGRYDYGAHNSKEGASTVLESDLCPSEYLSTDLVPLYIL